MLDAGLHVEDGDVVALEQQVAHERLEERALRAHAPAAAALDGAHAQQGHAVDVDAARVDDVGDVGVQEEHAALARAPRPCAPR